MIHNITTLETNTPLLAAEETQQFIYEMDQLLKIFDFKGIIDLTTNYRFNSIDTQELNIFIDRAKEEQTNWYENPLVIKINAIDGKNGQIDHPIPVQIDHLFRLKLTT